MTRVRTAVALLLFTSMTLTWSFNPLQSTKGLTLARSMHRFNARTVLRGEASEPSTPAEIYVCSNHWCASRGAEAALASFVGLIPEEDSTDDGRTVLSIACIKVYLSSSCLDANYLF